MGTSRIFRSLFRARVTRVAGVALVCSALTVSYAEAQVTAKDYCAYADDLLFIGKDSVVNGDVASNGHVELKGGAGVNGDVHAGAGVGTATNVNIVGSIFDIGLVTLASKTVVSKDIHNNGDTKSTGNYVQVLGTITHPAGTLLSFNALSSFGAEVIGVPQPPVLPGLPTPTVFPAFTGPDNPSPNLTPGNYGNVVFPKTSNITFQPGVYYFKSLEIGSGSEITFAGPVTVNVVGDMILRKTITTVSLAATPTDPKVQVEVHGNFTQEGAGSWVGNVFAPFGRIHVGSGGSVNSWFGLMHAVEIDIEHSVAVACPPGTDIGNPPTEPGKDSTVAHGQKNANEGGSPILTVGTQIYTVVGFTPPSILGVTKATLKLTVDPNVYGPNSGPASGWGANGKLVGAYSLNQDFIEGNGYALGLNVNFPGTGVGVTFNCGADQDISNEGKECLLPGTYALDTAATPTDTVLHTNGMTGSVEFDVTADVLAGKFNWLLKKAQSGGGEVRYYSKEGAAVAGNPALAPQLILQ